MGVKISNRYSSLIQIALELFLTSPEFSTQWLSKKNFKFF